MRCSERREGGGRNQRKSVHLQPSGDGDKQDRRRADRRRPDDPDYPQDQIAPEAIDVADGELGLVDRSRLITLPSSGAADKLRFFRMLLYIAAERGYQRGWAVHKYRERFGAWPEVRFADPMPPDAAIRSWVRSRQIAFARAQAKAAGAA